MLVILEGADGSGKTSLSTRLRKNLDPYILLLRSNGPPHHIEQLASVVNFMKDGPRLIPVITDRHPLISEFVYGPILRGECMHSLDVRQMATLFWDSMIVYCRPNYAALAAGVREETQMEGIVMNHRRIVRAYDDLMGQLEEEGTYIKRYDYTGPPQLVLDSIKTFIRKGQYDGKESTKV